MFTRRRVVCVASVLVLMILCASSVWGVYTKDFRNQDDFNAGIHERISYSPEQSGITLSKSMISMPLMWIPNTEDSSVSKVDARTGMELSKYKLGTSGSGWMPVSVASDYSGNAYIACICPGAQAKIIKIDASTPGNAGAAGISQIGSNSASSEEIKWDNKSRAKLIANVGVADSIPSSVVFDGNGGLWVSLWSDRTVERVSIETGMVTASVEVQGKPTTMLMDGQGFLWVLCRDARTLCLVNTATCTLSQYYDLGECTPSGMCFDLDGNIWIGNMDSGLLEFLPNSGAVIKHEPSLGTGFSSVCVDKNGDIWACCAIKDEIWHLSADDGSYISYVKVGKDPGAICKDEEGLLWVLNQASNTAMRIDTEKNSVIQSVKTGNAPYSSTAFATSCVKKSVSHNGYWNTVCDSRVLGSTWDRINWDSTECGGTISVKARTADTLEELSDVEYQNVENGEPVNLTNGRYMEVIVTLANKYDESPVLRSMRVIGANQPPDISNAVATVAKIVENDHKLVPVNITGVKDPEGGPVNVIITKVTQNEAVDKLTKDDVAPDAVGVGNSQVWLRAEYGPATTEKPYAGRTYEISFVATDNVGSSTRGKVKVEVSGDPSDLTKISDSGKRFDSTGMPQEYAMLKVDR